MDGNWVGYLAGNGGFLFISQTLLQQPTTHWGIGGAHNAEHLKCLYDIQATLGIGTTSPASKLDVNGGIRMADDSSTASASNVGTLKYYTSGNNSYVDMCMQTGATTYAWVNIVQNNW